MLFNDSILYNIAYAKPTEPSGPTFDINDEKLYAEVVAAAKKARIHDTIMTMPDGYSTGKASLASSKRYFCSLTPLSFAPLPLQLSASVV